MPRIVRVGADAGAWLHEDAVAAVARDCRVARTAVATRLGPQVTPQLCALAAGRLWMVTSRHSLKVRVLRRRPEIGVLLRSGRRAVVLTGEAEVLEPWGVGAALRLAAAAPFAGVAALRFGVRHCDRLLGYAADLLRLPPPPGALPHDRVLLAVRPRRGVVWSGQSVTAELEAEPLPSPFAQPVGAGDAAPSGPPRLPATVPESAASLLRPRQVATLGWSAAAGPLALPATWDAQSGRASVPTELLERFGAPLAAPACIAFDRSAALRPSRLCGLVLRGEGRRHGGEVELELERVTWWSGFRISTVEVPEADAATLRALAVPARARAPRPSRRRAAAG